MVKSSSTKQHPFAVYLEGLREDRAALAALRRGLGRPPGYAPEMFPYVVPFLSERAGGWQEETYYVVASLFGLHPEPSTTGDLGDHFAKLRSVSPSIEAVERRFTALLAAHPEDLAFYLRQAIGLLKSKEVPVNWHQLLQDVLRWHHPDSRVRVRKRWASAFWGRPQKEHEGQNAG